MAGSPSLDDLVDGSFDEQFGCAVRDEQSMGCFDAERNMQVRTVALTRI
jgi:hypothetical protein